MTKYIIRITNRDAIPEFHEVFALGLAPEISGVEVLTQKADDKAFPESFKRFAGLFPLDEKDTDTKVSWQVKQNGQKRNLLILLDQNAVSLRRLYTIAVKFHVHYDIP